MNHLTLALICMYNVIADVLDVVSYGEGNSSITWLDIGCNNGNEMNILQCNSVRDTNTSRCGLTGSDVGLRCLPPTSSQTGSSIYVFSGIISCPLMLL